jgi:hypothetical protein
LEERSQDETTLVTVELDNRQLGEYPGGSGDHPHCTYQLVDVEFSKEIIIVSDTVNVTYIDGALDKLSNLTPNLKIDPNLL